MTCGVCKQDGHTKRTCPTLKAAAVTPDATVETTMMITLDNSNLCWDAYASQCYDNFQPFDELIDNAIAAITAVTPVKGTISINFNFDANIGSIEHSGGITFPTDAAGLTRCMTYGGKRATHLNEHGCGLKSSLAILDRSNTAWAIWFKCIENGVLMRYRLAAPYGGRLSIAKNPSPWPGSDTSNEPGSCIQFPLRKESFAGLYAKKDAKMADMAKLNDRIKCHFSHMWMKHPDVMEGRVRIHYNGEAIVPFSFQTAEVYEHVERLVKKEFTLSTGARVEIEEITLKPGARVPGTHTFKHAMSSTGVVLFKNGRYIEFITCDGDVRRLYSKIFGCVPHNSHNGRIRLVNMMGTQDTLPATVTTKNQFQPQTPLFEEFVSSLSKNITPYEKAEHVSEETMVIKYKNENEAAAKAMGIVCTYELEVKFLLEDGSLSPPIDLVRSQADKIEVMEFKVSPKVQVDHLSQLMMNWLLAKAANPGKEVSAILVLPEAEIEAVGKQHRQYLLILKEACGFAPVIRTNKNRQLYP